MSAQRNLSRSIRIAFIGTLLLGVTSSLVTAVPVLTIEPNETGQLITWDEVEGRDYVLQGSGDAENWTDLGLSVTQPGGSGPYQVMVPTVLSKKFYQLFKDGVATQAAYVGPERCSNCHSGKYNDWRDGGHPHKLNKVVNGQAPTYFSTNDVNVPDPPVGVNWSDVSYVIGGAIWKARFIGQDGYIITSTPDPADGHLVQFNLANELHGESWATYHTGETKAYNCGACHTTGWVSTADGSRPKSRTAPPKILFPSSTPARVRGTISSSMTSSSRSMNAPRIGAKRARSSSVG